MRLGDMADARVGVRRARAELQGSRAAGDHFGPGRRRRVGNRGKIEDRSVVGIELDRARAEREPCVVPPEQNPLPAEQSHRHGIVRIGIEGALGKRQTHLNVIHPRGRCSPVGLASFVGPRRERQSRRVAGVERDGAIEQLDGVRVSGHICRVDQRQRLDVEVPRVEALRALAPGAFDLRLPDPRLDQPDDRLA